MKSFLQQVLLISSLVVFAAACGKDSSKKSSSSTPAYYPLNTTASQSGVEAMTSLGQWLAVAENSPYSIGLYNLRTSSSGFNLNFNFCFKNCVSTQYPKCFVKGVNGNYSVGTTTTSNNIPQCTSNLVEKPKASNTQLSAAVTGAGLTLVSAERQGNVYTVTWRNPNSFNGNTVYVIDVSMPSAINPVASQINGQSTYVEIGML